MSSPLDSPGRYGTIQLLRQNPTADVVTSFGVDTATVSFGRDTACSVRLYYPDVAPVHARIVFNDARKAFLEVLGSHGLLVDGCLVYPHEEGSGKTKTIPLGNASELEIHGKRFRFTYPPKEMRAALAASPARPANRALRLSMIASAQVFSPCPSPDPRQNLRVLQSPFRAPFAPASPPSPSPAGTPPRASTDEHITLVQGSHPRVVEEARDLVILEDIEVAPAPSPSADRGRPANSAPQQPRTPRRQSLHRAVLIRSAQRAVWAANSANASPAASVNATPTARAGPVVRGWGATERQQNVDAEEDETDTEEEEEEVRSLRLEVVSVSSGSDVSDEEDAEVPVRGDDEEEEQDQDQAPRLGWRKSLERIALWPFAGRVKKEEEEAVVPAAGEEEGDNDNEDTEEIQNEGQNSNDEDENHADEDEVQMMTPAAEMRTPTQGQQTPKRRTVQSSTRPQVYATPPETHTPSRAQQVPRPAVATPARASPAPATTPARATPTPARAPPTLSFGAPHPAARTPRGFGRKSLGAEGAQQDVPMDVDPAEAEAAYVPVYEDLAAYRVDDKKQESTPKPVKDGGVQQVEEATPQRAGAVSPQRAGNATPQRTAPATPQRADPKPQPQPAAAARPLPAFMTPQAAPRPTGAAPRYSLGGAARRVRVEDSPWKVRDLVVAPAAPARGTGTPAAPGRISDEERRAISERRRSALKAPDAFFAGGVPGMSPVKVKAKKLGRVEEDRAGDVVGGGGGSGVEVEEQDSRSLLENLRETVEGLKRRRDSVFTLAGRTPSDERKEEEGEEGVGVEFDGEAEREKEKSVVPKARMLRGRPREEPQAPVEVEETEEVEAEPEPVVQTKKAARAKSAVREAEKESTGRRSRKATAEPDDGMDVDAPAPAPAPAKPARRTRKTTPTPAVEESEPEPAEAMVVDPAPAPAKTIRRGRKPTAEPETDDEPAALPTIPAAPSKARRGRKGTAEPESDNEPAAPAPVRRARKPVSTSTDAAIVPATEPAAPPKRRGRAPKAATPASAPEPARKTTRGRSRAPVEEPEDGDADPLDSIAVVPEVEVVAVVPAPGRRARSVKPAAVKDEETEPVLEAEGTAAPARSGRAKKTVAAAPPVPAAPKPRATRKRAVPASAPTAVEVGEKENAPGEEREEDEPVVKVRVSRSRKVKEEVAEPDTTARRATRARTRT